MNHIQALVAKLSTENKTLRAQCARLVNELKGSKKEACALREERDELAKTLASLKGHMSTPAADVVSDVCAARGSSVITAAPILTTPAKRRKRRPATPASIITIPDVGGGSSASNLSLSSCLLHDVIQVFLEDVASPWTGSRFSRADMEQARLVGLNAAF